MEISNEKLKQILEGLELVSKESLATAWAAAQESGRSLAEVIVASDLISDAHLGQIIADALGFKYVDLSKSDITDEVLQLIPALMAKKQRIIAFERGADGIKVAMADPTDIAVINRLEKKFGENIMPYYATPTGIEQGLIRYQKGIKKEFAEIIEENISQTKVGGKAKDLPVIKIVDTLVAYANDNKASDIHIEPGETRTLVRFRVDGVMHDVIELPKIIHDLIVTRIKILSKLRTDEHQAAQDGKFRFSLEDGKLDVRVSILPIVEGEKVVMRLLSEKSRQFSLEDLGMSGEDLLKVKREYSKPYGMILATGPTGCGKTTTLYAILKILNRREVNISTIEDPVEYDIEGVNQIQVNPRTNLTFAAGLKSILRQDPNIIMVGEIRDQETASIAVNAAMTGHLVLSTVHTNDAPTTLPRFLEMGLQPFLISSTVNLIVAQRLVRKNCSQCIASEQVSSDVLKEKFSQALINKYFGAQKKSVRIYHSRGCKVCGQTGYTGRVGIFEVLPLSEEIRKLIMKSANADEIRQQAVKEGMTTMIEDGIKKVLSGVTTLEEVLRATRE